MVRFPSAQSVGPVGNPGPLFVPPIIKVTQNLMASATPKSRRVELKANDYTFPARPLTVTLDGKSYTVTTQSTRGTTSFTRHTVELPILKDGLHPANVLLENGESVRIIFQVESIY